MNVDDIRRIVVVGGGLMGSGIAQEFAAAGYDVALQDIAEDQLQTAVMRMRENLTLLAEYELIEAASVEAIVGRVTCTTMTAMMPCRRRTSTWRRPLWRTWR